MGIGNSLENEIQNRHEIDGTNHGNSENGRGIVTFAIYLNVSSFLDWSLGDCHGCSMEGFMRVRNLARFSTSRMVTLTVVIAAIAIPWISSDALAELSVLQSFTSTCYAYPNISLTLSGSTLYGTTEAGGTTCNGTIFKINTDGTGYQVLYTFTGGADGAWPRASLTLSGSTLYGTAGGGGVGFGTIFKINTDGSGFQILYTFFPRDSDIGANPWASLTLSGSTLYGTTAGMGAGYSSYGTIFKINTDGTGYQVLYTFSPTATDPGTTPEASLTLSGSTLYGTTSGIEGGYGTIFKINTDGTGYQVLYSFTGGADGAWPRASLTLSGSTLYGTASGGGVGYGTIFKINTDSTGYQVFYNFMRGADGAYPYAALTLSGSTLYGTTTSGGTLGYGGWGTIFKINTDGTGYQVLYSFTGGADGNYPEAPLTLSDSILYGTTSAGGTDGGGGTVFELPVSTEPSCTPPTHNVYISSNRTSGLYDATIEDVNFGDKTTAILNIQGTPIFFGRTFQYWMSITPISASPEEVTYEPNPDDPVGGFLAEKGIIPPGNHVSYLLQFCKPATVQFEISATPRSGALTLLDGLMSILGSPLTVAQLYEVTDSAMQIPAYASAVNNYIAAQNFALAGREWDALQKFLQCVKDLRTLVADPGSRNQLFSILKVQGINIGLTAFVRALIQVPAQLLMDLGHWVVFMNTLVNGHYTMEIYVIGR